MAFTLERIKNGSVESRKSFYIMGQAMVEVKELMKEDNKLTFKIYWHRWKNNYMYAYTSLVGKSIVWTSYWKPFHTPLVNSIK